MNNSKQKERMTGQQLAFLALVENINVVKAVCDDYGIENIKKQIITAIELLKSAPLQCEQLKQILDGTFIPPGSFYDPEWF